MPSSDQQNAVTEASDHDGHPDLLVRSDNDIRNRPSTSKTASQTRQAELALKALKTLHERKIPQKTTVRTGQSRTHLRSKKNAPQPGTYVADLLKHRSVQVKRLDNTRMPIIRIKKNFGESPPVPESDRSPEYVEVVDHTKPLVVTAVHQPTVNLDRIQDDNDSAEKQEESSVADELRDLKHEHQQDMKEIRANMRKYNAELRATMAANEVANANRFQDLMGSFKELMEQFGTIKEQNNKTTQITKEIQLSVLSSHLEGNTITEKLDFVAPTWPLSTTEQVFDLNTKLENKEYRDQVFVRLNKWRLVIHGELRMTVKRYMLKMIHLDTLVAFSWSGKTTIDASVATKLVFMNLKQIIKLIQSLAGNNIPVCDVTNEIKYIMKRIPQYMKARLKRPDAS